MTGCGCNDTASALCRAQDAARRRVLWAVLTINLVLFAGEFSAGWWADSSALQADSLDSLGDAGVYLLSLAVIAGSVRQRAGAAVVKGAIQGVFGLAVLAEVARRAWFGAEPLAPVMAIAACMALVGNLVCFGLLSRFRADDLNMRSVWLCSRNDLVNNSGVIIAAALVAWSGAAWPDLLVGLIVAALFLHTSWQVLRAAWRPWRHPGTAAEPALAGKNSS